MKTKVLIPLLYLSILSSLAQGQDLQIFNLSITQLPPLEYEATDSITLELANSVLLDTIVSLKGTESYTIDWFVKQNGNYIQTPNLIEVIKDTSIYYRIASHSTCTVFDSIHIQHKKSTSIKYKFDRSQNIRIYPNPTDGKISIHMVGNSGSIELCLYDLRGNRILSKEAEILNNNENTLELNLSDYRSGIYILEVVSKDLRYHQKISLLK